MSERKLAPILKKVIQKQFECAGHKDVNLEKINFTHTAKTPWYSEYTWTESQQDKFLDWLYTKLSSDVKYREGIMEFPNLKTSNRLYATVAEWNLMFGFKVEEK